MISYLLPSLAVFLITAFFGGVVRQLQDELTIIRNKLDELERQIAND